ncbi:hypothetical protein CspHIS471_0700970 [Cutaneotrichosporon sp. HIS471]|nr:hypothetical protein CspHIS471_0700970 [Cutaneotrichosporon sp. HIS471]
MTGYRLEITTPEWTASWAPSHQHRTQPSLPTTSTRNPFSSLPPMPTPPVLSGSLPSSSPPAYTPPQHTNHRRITNTRHSQAFAALGPPPTPPMFVKAAPAKTTNTAQVQPQTSTASLQRSAAVQAPPVEMRRQQGADGTYKD